MGHDQPDFYEILGVARTASPEEVTQAYRKAMKAVHPDASGTSGLFRLVKTAYDTLKDPQSRAAYDGRQATAEPSPGRGRQEQHFQEPPYQEPPWRDEPSASQTTTGSTPRSGADEGTSTTTGQGFQGGGGAAREAASIGMRPRFGAHWTKLVVATAWTMACAGMVYLLWPAGLPRSLMVLLLLPVAAGPIVSGQHVLRSMVWPWGLCLVVFVGSGALTVVGADHGDVRPYCVALVGLLLGGLALAAAPVVVSRGRELDALVDPESVTFQIFNVPGAGLGDERGREISRISADEVEELLLLDGTRILHAIAPQLPGRESCYVDHAVTRDRLVALVMVRCWPAAAYAWTDRGVLTADGRRFPGCDTGIAEAVQAVRSVMPRGVRVRGFVSIQPQNPVRPGEVTPAGSGRDDFFVGSSTQVCQRLNDWLAQGEPVVDRRVFAALLRFLRHPNDR